MSIPGTGPEHTLRDGLRFIDAFHAKFDRDSETDRALATARAILIDLAEPAWLTAAAGRVLQDRARAWLADTDKPDTQ